MQARRLRSLIRRPRPEAPGSAGIDVRKRHALESELRVAHDKYAYQATQMIRCAGQKHPKRVWKNQIGDYTYRSLIRS